MRGGGRKVRKERGEIRGNAMEDRGRCEEEAGGKATQQMLVNLQ